jgi:hypothetical protein
LPGAIASAFALIVVGCSYNFKQPASSSTTPVPSPVPLEVTWNADGRNFVATVDGVDSTSRFTVSGRSATATLNLSPGTHILRAGGQIYCWYCSPQWTSNMQERTLVIEQPPQPTLTMNGPYSVQVGQQVQVTVSRNTTGSAATVTVSRGNANVSLPGSQPAATVQLGAGVASGTTTITGVTAGSSSLTATATGYVQATAGVTVTAPPPPAPTIASLSPNSGPVGTGVTISGSNFASGAQVRFGSTAATSTFVSASQVNTTVPGGVSGTVNVTVTVGGQESNAIPFTVTTTPGGGGTPDLVARASDSDVQVYDMNATPPVRVSAQAAILSPGGLAGSAVALSGLPGTLIRGSADGVQAFSITAAGVLGAQRTVSALPSTSGAIASSGTNIVRGHDSGIQLFRLVNGAPQQVTNFPTSAGSGGVAVAISGTTVVRSTGTMFEVISIATPSSPQLLGSAPATPSGTGVALAFLTATRVIRAFDSGIEVFDISTPSNPVQGPTSFTGAQSSANVAVATSGGTRAVRATTVGIDVYTIGASTITLAGSKNNAGDLSATGVGLALSGNNAYRTTDDNVERYDISSPASIPAPKVATSAQHGVTQSATGTGAVKP